MDLTNINSLLTWLIYSGGAILLASWVLDKIVAFQTLSPETKSLINKAVSVGLALGFYALIRFVPASVFASLDDWFKVAAGVLVLYGGQQLVHQSTK